MSVTLGLLRGSWWVIRWFTIGVIALFIGLFVVCVAAIDAANKHN